jgi:hypothetical protein
MGSPAAEVDFDPGRISMGETIAAASGFGLLVFMFFHWFAGASAWKVFDVVDFLLALLALLAIAVAGAKALGRPLFNENTGLVLLLAGTVASSITLTFVLEGNDRKIGLYLSFLSALGMLYGGWRRMSEAPDATGPLAGLGGRGGARTSATTGGAATEPTTRMPADESPGVPGGGAAGVPPGKEGPGAPHPGTSTGAPGDEDETPPPAAAMADPVPGETGGGTPPGLAGGEPPASATGTQPPGI